MKNKIKFLFVLLAAVLLVSCAKEQEPIAPTIGVSDTAEPRSEKTELSISEETAIDDSYTMPIVYNDGDTEKYKEELHRNIVESNLSRFLDNAQVIKTRVKVWNGEYMYGWMLCSGEPRQDIGWPTVEVDGQELYCRSITAHLYDSETWQVDKSFSMLPYEELRCYEPLLPSSELPEGCSDYKLANLTSASLYVQQLGETFTITDDAGLRQLETSLSKQQGLLSGFAYGPEDTETFNPLYLYFADGSQRLVYTPGDGRCGSSAWDGFFFNGAQSLFEIFGVPLPSPGYIHNQDGTTTVQVELHSDNGDGDFIQESVYSADNLLLSKKAAHDITTYSYTDDNLVQRGDTYTDGKLTYSTIYEYNDLRQLVRQTEAPVNGVEYYYEYSYDEFGRRVSAVSYYGDAVRDNMYYWYDDEGKQHQYYYENGALIGEPAPNDNPMRREIA
jgi:hypothetical protein